MLNEKLKHLEFIQNVITRMNTNSFMVKGWAVTIISAILALYAGTRNNYFLLIGILPTLIFWFLDSYYLSQEKKFRGLYDDIAGISEKPIKLKPFAMRPDLYTKGQYSYLKTLVSITIWPIYLLTIIILIVIFKST